MTTHLTGQKMFFAGEWVNSDQFIEVRNPQDNSIIDLVPAATSQDMLNCVEEAKEGAEIAAAMPVHERIKVINGAADYIEQHGASDRLIYVRRSMFISYTSLAYVRNAQE